MIRHLLGERLPPTLVDIARETGTSISTVSRVLSGGSASARISDDTKQRVLEAAHRLGYRPNLVARSLRTRKSNTIALLVSDIANPWFGQIASLVEQTLHVHGYSLMLCNSGEDIEREREYLSLLPAKGIDGLIVVPLARSRKALLELLPPDLPIVVLDRPIPGISACVASDQEQATGILCDALARAGVKRVAVAMGPQQVVTHRARFEVIARRFQVIAQHEGPAQNQTGRKAFINFLNEQPDAIVCTNNFLGQGVIDSIGHVENSFIIGCFDEIPMMHLLPIPIVCTIQDVPRIADGCVQLLLPQLTGDNRGPGPIFLPARTVCNVAFQTRQHEASQTDTRRQAVAH